MGERAFEEQANDEDLERMAGQLEDAIRAGAIGLHVAQRTPRDLRQPAGGLAARRGGTRWAIWSG